MFLEGFFSSLIRFQESPASVAVRAQVDYIRDDRFVMQCNECKKVTLNEVRFVIVYVTCLNFSISGSGIVLPLQRWRAYLSSSAVDHGKGQPRSYAAALPLRGLSIVDLLCSQTYFVTGTCQSIPWQLREARRRLV